MTAQTKYDSSHYNCEAMKIASMPGGGTTIGDVHDAIEKLINSEVLSVLEELESNALVFTNIPQNTAIPPSALQSIKNRYKEL